MRTPSLVEYEDISKSSTSNDVHAVELGLTLDAVKRGGAWRFHVPVAANGNK